MSTISHLARDAAWSYPVHPTQIYESLVGLSLFGLLMLLRRYRRFSGQVFLGWVFGYGILRSIIEIYRDDDDRGLYTLPFTHVSLSTSQIIGIVSVVLGLVLLVNLRRRYQRDPAGAAALAAAGGRGGRARGGGGALVEVGRQAAEASLVAAPLFAPVLLLLAAGADAQAASPPAPEVPAAVTAPAPATSPEAAPPPTTPPPPPDPAGRRLERARPPRRHSRTSKRR